MGGCWGRTCAVMSLLCRIRGSFSGRESWLSGSQEPTMGRHWEWGRGRGTQDDSGEQPELGVCLPRLILETGRDRGRHRWLRSALSSIWTFRRQRPVNSVSDALILCCSARFSGSRSFECRGSPETYMQTGCNPCQPLPNHPRIQQKSALCAV
jgi:hypothetical protein